MGGLCRTRESVKVSESERECVWARVCERESADTAGVLVPVKVAFSGSEQGLSLRRRHNYLTEQIRQFILYHH